VCNPVCLLRDNRALERHPSKAQLIAMSEFRALTTIIPFRNFCFDAAIVSDQAACGRKHVRKHFALLSPIVLMMKRVGKHVAIRRAAETSLPNK